MLVDGYRGIASVLGLAGDIEGRKKLQKLVYLAEEMGFPGLREPFDYHWFGPYSEVLASELDELTLLGAVTEEESRTPGGFPTYSYSLTEKGREYFAESIAEVISFKRLVEMLVAKSARFLELAATLYFFLSIGNGLNEATQEVQIRKAEQRYSDEECHEAARFLQELKQVRV